MAIVATMRARWIETWGGKLRDGRREKPHLGRGEVLLDVEACGIGLTVLNCIAGDLGDSPDHLPRIPGHEVVGKIVATGEGIGEEVIGRRGMAYFYLSCGYCRMCVAGQESMCERLNGQIGVVRDGGYAEQVALPLFNVLPLPEDLDAAVATTIPDAIATPVHVAGRAGFRPGAKTVVIGAGGGVGIHMAQVAKLYGCEVCALDVEPEKLGFLVDELEIAAVDSRDFTTVALPTSWRSGVDIVVDLVGNGMSLAWAIAVLAPNGSLVLLTTFRDRDFELSPRDLVFGQKTVLASRYASRHELLSAADLVSRGAIRPVVSRVVGPDGIDAVHEDLREGRLLGRGALKW